MTILAYHAIDPAWRSDLSVAPALFERHVAWIAHRAVPLEAMLDAGGLRRVVAVTFDDGFASVHANAFPALAAARTPATVFLIASLLEDGAGGGGVPGVEGSPPSLTLEQVREMRDAGVRFGSHAFAHAPLTEMSDEELRRDLGRSKQILEDLLGEEMPLLAYPQGLTDARVRRAAERAGYRFGLAMSRTRTGRGPYEIPRSGVYPSNDVTRLAMKASPWYLRARTGRAYGAVAAIRARSGGS